MFGVGPVLVGDDQLVPKKMTVPAGTLGATSFFREHASGGTQRAGLLKPFSKVDLGSGRNTR